MQLNIKELQDSSKYDYHPTPQIYTEILMQSEVFFGSILEPCAGTCGISSVLNKFNKKVTSIDIQPFQEVEVKDFFEVKDRYDNVICAPPFHTSYEFICHAMEIADRKVAMLLRNIFIESPKYTSLLQNMVFPLRSIHVMMKTLPFSHPEYLNGYSWYVWDKHYRQKPTISWNNLGGSND